MSTLPVHQRPCHAFLSHSHADRAAVDRLFDWLSRVGGVPVWYDAQNLPAGAMIATHLADAVAQCRSVILVLSKQSVASTWVREEYEAAVGQRTQVKGFRIIPVLLEECQIPGFLQTTKWIELREGQATLENYGQLLADLYHHDAPAGVPGAVRDVYLSRSWRDEEAETADRACRQLVEGGFRLIGDAQDQAGFDEARVRSILASCGAAAAILPDRGAGRTSKYILRELEMAQALGLPCLVVADPGVEFPRGSETLAVSAPGPGGAEDAWPALGAGVSDLADAWRTPREPHYAFFATSFDPAERPRNRLIQQLVERVTAMPCALGDEIREGQVQAVIADTIRKAHFVLADISEDNVNTCIEAGIARGAGRRLHLLAREPRRRPAFMFRDQQVWPWADDLQLLGVVHRIAYGYRRRVLNWELDGH